MDDLAINLRYFDLKYLGSFVEKGEICFQSVEYFRKLEDDGSGISDINEVTSADVQNKGDSIPVDTRGGSVSINIRDNESGNQSVNQYTEKSNLGHIWCFVHLNLFDSKVFDLFSDTFQPPFVFKIKKKFLKSLEDSLGATGTSRIPVIFGENFFDDKLENLKGEINYEMKEIKYYSKLNPPKEISIKSNEDKRPFYKENKYAIQHEKRVFIKPTNDKGAIIKKLGSLKNSVSDIRFTRLSEIKFILNYDCENGKYVLFINLIEPSSTNLQKSSFRLASGINDKIQSELRKSYNN